MQLENENYVKNELNKLRFQIKLRELTLTDLLLDFDATCFYPSATPHNQQSPKLKHVMLFHQT